jgi:histidine triad (HIT) family protein
MCVFCKIISGEYSSHKIYEDEKVLAILDLSQATPGHTLVMPKNHLENIFELDDETAQHLFSVVKKICNHYKDTIPNLKGINLLNNNMERAGQTVMHYHMHILPRYSYDDLENMKFTEHKLDLTEICNNLKLN